MGFILGWEPYVTLRRLRASNRISFVAPRPSEKEPGTEAEAVDDDFSQGKGFAVTRTDGLVTISLRVVGQRGTRTWTRELVTAVSLRN